MMGDMKRVEELKQQLEALKVSLSSKQTNEKNDEVKEKVKYINIAKKVSEDRLSLKQMVSDTTAFSVIVIFIFYFRFVSLSKQNDPKPKTKPSCLLLPPLDYSTMTLSMKKLREKSRKRIKIMKSLKKKNQ